MSNAKIVKGLEKIKPEDIELYFKLNEQIKDLTKSLDAVKDKVKTAMISSDIDNLESGDYVVQLTNKTSKKLDEDMLVQVLAAKGLTKETTEIKIIPNKDKVLLAISDGKLSQAEYDLCNKISYSQAMTVKIKK